MTATVDSRTSAGTSTPPASPVRTPVPVAADWLDRREPADAAARSGSLAGDLDRALAGRHRDRPLRVHDLGAGAGSMMRWLAPRLRGTQSWVLHDVDACLLHRATGPAGAGRPRSADGAVVTARVRRHDITRLDVDEFADADLITASALLDLLTPGELDRLVRACVVADCPVLFTLSVTGRVALDPGDPLDDAIGDGFNAHQRRPVAGGRLLGPDAAGAVADALDSHGFRVRTAPSPWRLAGDQAPLALDWLAGWVGPAVEARPELAGPALRYLDRRRDQARRGVLTVTVHHRDVLAMPADPGHGDRGVATVPTARGGLG